MDWLSKRKFVIVCHEKVVKIPLEGDEILQVHGERTQGVVKTLMNTKVDEPKLSDISIVRDFIDVFRKIVDDHRNDKLRLPEELNSVHDTFHVSNLKKCLADASLHVPLDEIKVDKTLRFVEEPVEIMDREIRKLKRRNIALVKVRWNSKRGPEFTWEHEDQWRIKYPQLFVDRVVKPVS
ncbi:hypothetical protein Tco_0476177 [Tanacetum coccineum]